MSARVWWRNAHTGTAEITSYLRTDNWTLTENAEEGSTGAATLQVDDRGAVFGALTMLGSHIEVIDADCPGDSVIWAGHIGEQTLSHGDTVLDQQWSNPTVDRNYAWGRRVMTGTACKRPAETDTQRMAWLLSTDEANADFDDVTTYVSTAAGTPMDACDYRGQMFDQVASDCAGASGRNWWAQEIGNAGTATGTAIFPFVKTTAWYDYDTSTAYAGTCVITNDPALIDLATYWPPSQDAELYRDFSRVYSGALGNWDGGSTYRTRAATASAYGRRDTVVPLPNVKSAAKAAARLDRMLLSMSKPHLRVRVPRLEVPASVVNQFKPGMRIEAKFTHFTDGLNALWPYRILNRDVTQMAAGGKYALRLEMTPLTVPWTCVGDPTITATPTGSYAPLLATAPVSRADGMLMYASPGDTPVPFVPNPSFSGSWGFPVYNSGGVDYWGDCMSSGVYIIVAGPGTITLHTVTYGGSARHVNATLQHYNPVTHLPETDDSATSVATGTDITLTSPDDGYCYHQVYLTDDHADCGGKVGFAGYDWVSAA